MNSFSGICWRQEGDLTQLFWGAGGKEGSGVVKATWAKGKFPDAEYIPIEKESPAKLSLVNEVLFRNESGIPELYIVANGNNTVVKMNPDTKKSSGPHKLGSAPYGITMANGKIYVTNWAGKPA